MTITVPQFAVSSTGSASVSITGAPAVNDVVIYHVFSARSGAPRAVVSVDGLGGTWTALSNPVGTRSSWWISTNANASGVVTATFDFGTPTPSAAAWVLRGLPAGYTLLDLDDTQADPVVSLAGPTSDAELLQVVLAHGRCASAPITGPTAVSPATGWVENGSTSNADSAYRIPTAAGPAAHRVDYGSPLSGMMLASQAVIGVVPAPNPPTGLTQTGATTTTVDVGWTAPATGPAPTSYDYRINGGAVTSAGLVTTLHLTGLTPGTTYAVEVRSVSAGGVSSWVSVNATTTANPGPPTDLTQTGATTTSATVGWTAPATGPAPESYDVRVDGGAEDSTTDTTYDVTGLEPDTGYLVEVRSVTTGGLSAWEPLAVTTEGLQSIGRPVVGDRAERFYARLPEAYRDADASLENYPLLRYLSLLLDQLDPIDQLTERIDYDAEEGDATSDLVDGATANAGWLPWLAQLLGVDLVDLTLAEQRTALSDPAQVWAHGTPSAIAAAAARGLTGTADVTVTAHYGEDPWVIGIGTLDSETVILDQWGELMAEAPTWANLHALGSFAVAAAPLVLAAAEKEQPAGYRLVRYSTGA